MAGIGLHTDVIVIPGVANPARWSLIYRERSLSAVHLDAQHAHALRPGRSFLASDYGDSALGPQVTPLGRLSSAAKRAPQRADTDPPATVSVLHRSRSAWRERTPDCSRSPVAALRRYAPSTARSTGTLPRVACE